ncbi:unnamed protein product [Effrenium voratum]|nr:unnamed protein product [Effrenium voratum]
MRILKEPVQTQQEVSGQRKKFSGHGPVRYLCRPESKEGSWGELIFLDPQCLAVDDEPPIQRASLLLAQWEEEAKREQEVAQRQRAAEEIQEAIEDGDWDTIESAVQAGLESGLEEEAEPVRAARAKLESLREARELHEAKRTIQQTEARLQQLQQAEAQLAGPSHKKERSAIGKEMMKLRNGEEYISARSFLKNPEQVRPGS